MTLPYWKTCADKPSQRLVVALRIARRHRLPFRFQGTALMESAAFRVPTDSQLARIHQVTQPVLTERLHGHTLAVLRISYS